MKFAWAWPPWVIGRSGSRGEMSIRLVVGLGNPGRKYVGTPHNVGFAVVEYLAELWGCRLHNNRRRGAMLAKSARNARPVWLVQPLSYMNNSGTVVSAIMRQSGIATENLIVVLDDVDLPLGRIRVRIGGGDAGHRGLRSVRECLGSSDFTRVRLGVGRAERSGGLVEYVLTPFPASVRPVVARMVETAGEAVSMVLDSGAAAAMNEYNSDKDHSRR